MCILLKMNFRTNKTVIEIEDTVIIYFGHDAIDHLIVKKDEIKQTKYGAIKHNQLIGHKYGTKFNTTKGWVYVLKPTPELWTLSLPHRTQILYAADIAMITLQLDLKPGDIVCESGTGSASLSHSILRTIAPSGFLHTTEFHEQRAKAAQQEFRDHGYDDCVKVYHGDVIANGFSCTGEAEAVFLDIPKPWEAIKHAITAFKPRGGRLCSFSPCIEQVQRTCETLREFNFDEIQTVELVQRNHNIRKVLLPVADIGLSNERMKQSFFDNEETKNVLRCAYESGDRVEVGEIVSTTTKVSMKKKNLTHKLNHAQDAKRQKLDVKDEEDTEEKDTNNANKSVPTNNKGYTPPTTKSLFSTRTYVPPKQIYGHTGYLTFGSYFSK